MSASKTKWVRLGDYIELCDERNSDGKYRLGDVRGISNQKELIPTKADMKYVSLTPYILLKPKDFSYVTVTSRNGGKTSLAMNDTQETYIVSSSYINFRSKDKKKLLPEYLYILLSRSEFDRYARFNSWGSARETFDWDEMCRMEIPLPSIEVQQELVDTYNGLKQLAEDNEALVDPLTQACEAMIVDCKKKYKDVALGQLIQECDERNSGAIDYPFYGINKDKTFMPTVADTNKLDNSKYKLVKKDIFVFSGMQTGRDVCIRIALQNKEDIILVSPAYTTFRVKDIDKIIPPYLFLQFSRYEMDRLGWFLSDGSIRSNLDWNRFCEIKIPLPPIAVQQSIVNVYHCIEEARRIAERARNEMRTLCPALIQKAIHA